MIYSEYIDIKASGAKTSAGDAIVYTHPSCVDETKEGTLLIAFNGGIIEGEGDNQVFLIRKPKDGDWSEPVVIESSPSIDFGVIYQPRYNDNNVIICGYWWPGGCCSKGAFRTSTDDGQTWSSRTVCPSSNLWDSGIMTMGMNHPLEFPNGDIWFASANIFSDPQADARIVKVPQDSYTSTSDWEAVDIEGNNSDNHYMGDWLVLDSDYQNLMRMSRANFNGGTYYKMSTDGGQTWENQWHRMNADLSCGISFTSLDAEDASRPLHGYHIGTGSWHSIRRASLDVFVSTDPAANEWTNELQCNRQPLTGEKIENADPTVFQSRDGTKIHLVFTGREIHTIRHYVIDPYKLTGETPTHAIRDVRAPIKSQGAPNDEMYTLDGRRIMSTARNHGLSLVITSINGENGTHITPALISNR
ncbi:MAG: hypothetical protein GF398_02935 [Chitinivibrionales bacterium]|nr:hypothetical protein [Chitinivibrionales bacterium]